MLQFHIGCEKSLTKWCQLQADFINKGNPSQGPGWHCRMGFPTSSFPGPSMTMCGSGENKYTCVHGTTEQGAVGLINAGKVFRLTTDGSTSLRARTPKVLIATRATQLVWHRSSATSTSTERTNVRSFLQVKPLEHMSNRSMRILIVS